MLELLKHQGIGNATTQYIMYRRVHWFESFFQCKHPSRQRPKGGLTWKMHQIQCFDTNAFNVGNAPTRLNENLMCTMKCYNQKVTNMPLQFRVSNVQHIKQPLGCLPIICGMPPFYCNGVGYCSLSMPKTLAYVNVEARSTSLLECSCKQPTNMVPCLCSF